MNTGTAVKFVQITQARYDALQNKNEGTFYVVGSNEEYKLYLGSILIAEKNKNITNVYTFKGSVNTVSDLPANASAGDVYDVVLTGMNYAWTGTKWDALGQYVDVSVLATKSEVNTGLAGKQDVLVSGTNIKTINDTSLLGSGNINISDGSEQFDIIEYGVSTYEDAEHLLRSSTKPRLILQGTQLFFITALRIFPPLQSIGCYYGNRTDDGTTVNALALVNQNDEWSYKTVGYTIPTATSELQNDSDFQTATQVDTAINSKIASVYKAKGSIAFANLPALTSANEGAVYNINESFTTTNDFIEGAGKTYPAGTNVVIIDTGNGVYKYDVLAGLVDLSGKQDTLVSGTNIKTINTLSLLDSGNINLCYQVFPNFSPFAELVEAYYNIATFYCIDDNAKSHPSSVYAIYDSSSQMTSLEFQYQDGETLYTWTVDSSNNWNVSSTINLQSKLVGTQTTGQNIKTINNESLLGSGNVEIPQNVFRLYLDDNNVCFVDADYVRVTFADIKNIIDTADMSINVSNIDGSLNYSIHKVDDCIIYLSAGDSLTVVTYDNEDDEYYNSLEVIILSTYAQLQQGLSQKQNTLVSGTNIKTINNQSILGSGDISVSTVAAQIVRW